MKKIEMSEKEKNEVQNLYRKYARESLKERKGMTEEEEYHYIRKKEKEMHKDLMKIKKKYDRERNKNINK